MTKPPMPTDQFPAVNSQSHCKLITTSFISCYLYMLILINWMINHCLKLLLVFTPYEISSAISPHSFPPAWIIWNVFPSSLLIVLFCLRESPWLVYHHLPASFWHILPCVSYFTSSLVLMDWILSGEGSTRSHQRTAGIGYRHSDPLDEKTYVQITVLSLLSKPGQIIFFWKIIF